MNLYQVLYDSQHYYVEAESFPAAIDLWKAHVAKVWDDDFDGYEEPESVALIHDGEVIRSMGYAQLEAPVAESRDILALMIAGVVRWEWLQPRAGELCYEGIRYHSRTDDRGCPIIPDRLLAARFAADDRRGMKHHG